MDSLDEVMKARAQRTRVETQTGRKLAPDEQVGEGDAPSDILSEDGDPEKKALMGMLLKTLAPDPAKQDDLQERFKNNGPFTDEQLKLMQDARYEFNERYMLLNEAKTLFGADELQQIANKHAGYGKYMAGFTPERAKELTDMHFASLAMRNVKSLRRLVDERKAIEEKKKNPGYRNLLADVEWATKATGLSAKDLTATVDLSNRAGSEARLQAKVREQYDQIQNRPLRWFKKACDWAFNSSGQTARSAFDAMNDTDKATVVKEINKNINIIGLVLMNTIRPRADFIAALSQEVWGGKKVELEGMEQVTSATDVESRRAKITDTALQTRWNTEKDKLSQDKFKKKYGRLNPAQADSLRDDFLSDAERKAGGRGSTIFASILERIVFLIFGSHRINKATLLP